MISFGDAYVEVLKHAQDYGNEICTLADASGRILGEDVLADRDLPPYNRATRDGIAIVYDAYENGRRSFEIEAVVAAGVPTHSLSESSFCVEIMTGGVVPYETDTVIMYEHLEIEKGIAEIKQPPKKGQNIHSQGSDAGKGTVLIEKNTRITAAEIGILAAVGYDQVPVKRNPKIAVISTGNELIAIDEVPKKHQIRRSNAPTIVSALEMMEIQPLSFHIRDDKDLLRQKLAYVIEEMDILILSGGISKGKFDFLPQVLAELGTDVLIHRVRQRPGKPFLFASHPAHKTLIFGYPGNPVSTFVTHHIYFNAWFDRSMELRRKNNFAQLTQEINGVEGTTQLIPVSIELSEGKLLATPVPQNGSGDFISLVNADGIVIIDEHNGTYVEGQAAPYIKTR
ncbi:MAG: molybdopterin molybdotransferase MoeA [Flavobacteriaceae bacterium]|nr:molybdopterin molybdotransferase MoeA [Flavobacteriaceae bacterium]